MIRRALLVLAIPLALAACSDATGEVIGGDASFDTAPPVNTHVNTACVGDASPDDIFFTSLYRDYFGPSGAATCARNGMDCHGGPNEMGTASTGGFVCCVDSDAGSMGCIDAGADAAQGACYASMTNSIVPVGGSLDPTNTLLYTQIRKAPPGMGGSMPKNSAFAFTTCDLNRITGWIMAGAKND